MDYEDSSDNESITELDEQLRQQAEIHPWLDYEFDKLMESIEVERRRILGQDALYTI